MSTTPDSNGRDGVTTTTSGGVVWRVSATNEGKAHPFPWGSIQWLCDGQMFPDAQQTFGYVQIKAGAKNPKHLDTLGFSGINNFPIVGLIDGRFRMELERTGMGFGMEVDAIRLAHERGFFTAVYVFNSDEAAAMAQAGADATIAHMGLTAGGSIGLESGDAMRLEDSPAAVQAIGDAARAVNGETMLLCHGGPIATPDDAAYVLARCDAVGFVGASSMERLPVETAITETTRAFKAVPLRGSSE